MVIIVVSVVVNIVVSIVIVVISIVIVANKRRQFMKLLFMQSDIINLWLHCFYCLVLYKNCFNCFS